MLFYRCSANKELPQGRRRENWVGQAIDYNVEIATVYMPMREELLHSVRSTLCEVQSTSILGGSGGMPPTGNF